ncbi:MAG: endolytic transglycosylase MltG [Clostridiales bacterium]|nr:endolytic transglycosylase MltG [Clostridiales bacterium]
MTDPDYAEEALEEESAGEAPALVDEEYEEYEEEYEPPRKKGMAGIKALLILLFLALALGGGVFGGRLLQSSDNGYNWENDLEPVLPYAAEEVIFTVERGWTLSRTAQVLYDSGLILNADSFIRLGKLENKAESLKAGRFLLSPSMSAREILDELVRGNLLTTKFTIPEGYTLKQIAKVFAEKGIAGEEEFWRAVRTGVFDFAFLEGLPADEHRLEGYLFPDTYLIELDEPLEEVLNRMLKRYEEIWAALPARKSDLSDREILILASIVQNEVKLDEERPVAAGVFVSRLDVGMYLQSCSTVQYYFDEPKYPLLTADTEIDFPYNTYLYPGLPPGPVGSPGKASLEAAVSPEDTEYLYFVARDDGSGGHYFSKTLAEHNKATAQARANRSKQ